MLFLFQSFFSFTFEMFTTACETARTDVVACVEVDGKDKERFFTKS